LQKNATHGSGVVSDAAEPFLEEQESMEISESLPEAVAMLVPIVSMVVIFAYLGIVGWAKEKRREREAFYRAETAKKLVEQGAAGGAQLLEMMRAEDATKARRRKEGMMLGGLITFVIGMCTSIFLRAVVPVRGVWTVGLFPLLVGLVLVVFAWVASGPSEPGESPRAP
jgi:hypothetical protein